MSKYHNFKIETFNPPIYERSEISTKIIVDMFLNLTKMEDDDSIILVTGSNKYAPVVETLTQKCNKEVIVAFWSCASKKLKSLSSEFINLDHNSDQFLFFI